jgi:hypothetical protein
MNDTLPFDDLEKVYEIIAAAIDEVGVEKESLFLAKLVITLAHQASDIEVLKNAVTIAMTDLEEAD